MKSNEFVNLVSSSLMNLDHTFRYSGTKLVEKETLSQHIVDTIMMGLKMVDEINHRVGYTFLNVDTYIKKAVFHDLEEVITGDIPRPLKYHDEATLSSMRQVADEVATELFQKEFSDWKYCFDLWSNAKSENEGYILKLVDTLVVANKVVKEATLLNNYYMLKVAHEVAQYIQEIKDHSSEYLNDWDDAGKKYIYEVLDGAITTMNDILSENEAKLRLCNNSMI